MTEANHRRTFSTLPPALIFESARKKPFPPSIIKDRRKRKKPPESAPLLHKLLHDPSLSVVFPLYLERSHKGLPVLEQITAWKRSGQSLDTIEFPRQPPHRQMNAQPAIFISAGQRVFQHLRIRGIRVRTVESCESAENNAFSTRR